MPNWAYTQYKIEGEENELNALYNTIKSLDDGDASLIENGFGKLWLGNLVHVLGGDWNKIYCRGQITDYNLDSDFLSIDTETAWGELEEVREFLQEKYPSLTFWYCTEESGMGIYETNDASGEIFPYRWVIDYYDGDDYYTNEYYKDLESLVQFLINEKLIPEGTKPTKADIINALENNMKDKESGYVTLNEFEVVCYEL